MTIADQFKDAVKSGDINALESLYEKTNAIIDEFGEPDKNGHTRWALLIIALKHISNPKNVVKWLIEHDYDPDENGDGGSALAIAYQKGFFNTAQCILEGIIRKRIDARTKDLREENQTLNERCRKLEGQVSSLSEAQKTQEKELRKLIFITMGPYVSLCDELMCEVEDYRLKNLTGQKSVFSSVNVAERRKFCKEYTTACKQRDIKTITEMLTKERIDSFKEGLISNSFYDLLAEHQKRVQGLLATESEEPAEAHSHSAS